METADVVLMCSDPYDVVKAIRLSQATVRKMKENLFWAAGYNPIAFPIAAGLLYEPFGLILRPEIAALSMAGSSPIVAVNATSRMARSVTAGPMALLCRRDHVAVGVRVEGSLASCGAELIGLAVID